MRTRSRRSETSAAPGRASGTTRAAARSFFRPADGGRKTRPHFFQPRPTPVLRAPTTFAIQRQEKNSGSMSPGEAAFKAFLKMPEVEETLDEIKGTLGDFWKKLSTWEQGALVGAAAIPASGLVFEAMENPKLQGLDYGKLLQLIPYSPLEKLQYTPPTEDEPAHRIDTGLDLQPLIDLVLEHDPEFPLSSAKLSGSTEFGGGKNPALTGGSFTVGFLEDLLKVEGKSKGPDFQVMGWVDLVKLFPKIFGPPPRTKGPKRK